MGYTAMEIRAIAKAFAKHVDGEVFESEHLSHPDFSVRRDGRWLIAWSCSAGEYHEVRAFDCPPISVSLGSDGVPIISREVGFR